MQTNTYTQLSKKKKNSTRIQFPTCFSKVPDMHVKCILYILTLMCIISNIKGCRIFWKIYWGKKSYPWNLAESRSRSWFRLKCKILNFCCCINKNIHDYYSKKKKKKHVPFKGFVSTLKKQHTARLHEKLIHKIWQQKVLLNLNSVCTGMSECVWMIKVTS